MPKILKYLKELEYEIQHTLFPSIVGRNIFTEKEDIIPLSVKWGGMGICKPYDTSDLEFAASEIITQQLKGSSSNKMLCLR